jgi:hypothetical protein
MTATPRIVGRANLVVAGLGLVAFVCLLPGTFQALFSLQPIDDWMLGWLHRAQALIGGGAVLLAILSLRTRAGPVAGLYLSLLLMLGAELGLRLHIRHLASPEWAEQHLAPIPVLDGPDVAGTHVDHPFLHYTARPHVGGYNYLGFKGKDHAHSKDPDTLRVALLGGSTTEWGLGEALRPALANGLEGTDFSQVEVLNFGLSGWTSTHSVVNFVLNVLDFDPDVVVVHHAWNDDGFEVGACPRGDYSSRISTHNQVVDDPGTIALLRLSALYRLGMVEVMTRATARQECCGQMERSAMAQLNLKGPRPGRSCSDIYALKGELWPLERNLRTIVQLAQANGIVPLLATLPRTTDRSRWRSEDGIAAAHIDRSNEVNRRVAGQTGALLLDLATSMGGDRPHFTDLAHVNEAGNLEKARQISTVILTAFADR